MTTNETKIKDYEKQIVRGTIKMWIEWGAILDALCVISDTIYVIDDEINSKLADEIGITDARNKLYESYDKIKDILEKYYPNSELIAEYNL